MKKSILYLACCVFMFSSCEKDENGTSGTKISFIQSLIVGENSFLSGFKDLDVGSTNNDNASHYQIQKD